MRRRMVVSGLLMIGLAMTLFAPDTTAKARSFRQQAKSACSASCGGGGFNKCRVESAPKPNQCPSSTFLTP